MTTIELIAAKDEYRSLDERQVLEACEARDSDNPIAREVLRLISAFEPDFHAQCEEIGCIPADVFNIGLCPIERVAFEMMVFNFRQSNASRGLDGANDQ